MLHTSGSKAPKTISAPNSGSDVSVSLQEVGAEFKMEPMIRIERTTYALRRHQDRGDTDGDNHSGIVQDPTLFATQIFPKLSENFRIFLRASKNACYTHATRPVEPVDLKPHTPKRRRK